jgi:RNA polymerase sigma-70 factor (ECF subfamily)
MELRRTNAYEKLFEEKTGHTFNKFYTKYYTKLIWYIQKYNITQLDAEGIASQAFMQSLEKIEQFNQKNHYSTWLFSIAKNLALQHKIDSKKEILVDTSCESSDDNAFNAFQYYLNSKIDNNIENDISFDNITNEKYNITLKEISKLDFKYKQYIELCDIQGKSYDEISQILGVKLQTVKNRLHHGRIKIIKNTQLNFKNILNNSN